MIWKKDFENINYLVETAVKEFYEKLRKTSDYLVFLANGDYVQENEGTKISPYVIENKTDGFKDKAWLQVLMTFLNSKYNFTNENTSDSIENIFYETMLYIHVWESRPFLRFLKRASNLIKNDEYLWKLIIKDKNKSVFLEQKILPILEKKELKISTIIKESYIKQIRDAIAHNEYWHNWSKPQLIFENYKYNPNRINEIHYNDWTVIFSKTFLLAYHLRNYFEIEKNNLDDELCKNGFKVKLMKKNGEKGEGLIFYNKATNKFSGRLI